MTPTQSLVKTILKCFKLQVAYSIVGCMTVTDDKGQKRKGRGREGTAELRLPYIEQIHALTHFSGYCCCQTSEFL